MGIISNFTLALTVTLGIDDEDNEKKKKVVVVFLLPVAIIKLQFLS